MMRTPKALTKACQLLRGRVRYKTAHFKNGLHEDVSEQVRNVTRLYVETWVVPLIDAIEKGDIRTLNALTWDMGGADDKPSELS